MTYWLLDAATFEAMQAAITYEIKESHMEKLAQFAQKPSIYTPENGNGVIQIRGVLTQERNVLAQLFGGGNTTYPSIVSAVQEADNDPRVSQIVLDVHSGGGETDGLFETIAVIQAASKPVITRASLAASAAYALAAQGKTIEAKGPSSGFGSIGVMGRVMLSSSHVEITSTNAPHKRPDPTTDEGKAVIRAYLDQIHELFVGAIAQGRGITAAQVNSGYGQGASFLAAKAKELGLIDSISGPTVKAVPSKPIAASGEGNLVMKFEEYRAAHPEEAAKAIALGAKQEQERVQAHITMGTQCGDMAIAVEAINSGVDLSHQPTAAKYLAAAMNRRDLDNRAADNTPVIDATKNVETKADEKDMTDILAEMDAARYAKESK